MAAQIEITILDEFGDYFGGHNDGLRRALRAIDGVPDASYLVGDTGVFVFDKLLKLVEDSQNQSPATPLAELAISLIAQAVVPASEAVAVWGVVPEHYELATAGSGGFAIRHRHFHALLPGEFKNRDATYPALTNLLLGSTYGAGGDFTYKGQPLSHCAPLGVDHLPQRPKIDHGPATTQSQDPALDSVSFVEGFPPVSERVFNDVKNARHAWLTDCVHVTSYLQEHLHELWAQASSLGLEALNDRSNHVPDYAKEDASALRAFYPELDILTDGSLYALYDSYQEDCNYMAGWTAVRDDGFLYYLLSRMTGSGGQPADKESGGWIAYALLRGQAMQEALSFGRAATWYDIALAKQAGQIADAMRYLQLEQVRTERHGAPILTFTDMFSAARTCAADADHYR